ncbi:MULTISPECIES: hypothetical protein [Actinomycetaceae]|uniref:Uncharacterized protein n=1 Tax=Gleimia europaea ACS-120-V-Col10b TaxID=883069 RepID=A0A9W5VVQ8_9ACTO|nr:MULTISPECIES: hypothetical protein [Actinomycetaceae]EPD29493.1 hypothetical protein HMPREF9238_01473 [Gleimia europaea ACS-120-V-Col10b]
MIEPMQFGPELNIPYQNYGKSLPRSLRKMSKHPQQPRVFNQAAILAGVGIPGTIVMLIIISVMTPRYFRGEHDDPYAVFVPILTMLLTLWMASMGLFRRYGVDQEKLWSKFGQIYYKEVRFDEVRAFGVQPVNARYKIYDADKKINLDYNRFDYTLAFIRLLEELQHRRFELDGVSPEDPNWEDVAQLTRNDLAWSAYDNHRKYYDSHPQDLAKLNALVLPPVNAQVHDEIR